MYGTLYRRVLLPLFERGLKGRQTLRYWREAELSQWWDASRLREFQLQALRNLLRHAAETCPAHRERFDQAGVDAGSLHTLEDFQRWPLMTREIIREQRLELRSIAPFRLLTKGTGGSSGVPLQFDLDEASHERRVAMTHRGYGWAGGEPGTKQLYVWGSHVGQVPRWKQLKSSLHARFNRHTMISCFDFRPETMRGHLERWNRCRPEVVVAYTGPLYELARYVEQHRLEVFAPRSIIVGAEKLHDFQRETMQRVFGAPVFETYGSREFMLIGAECERHSGLHLSMENLLVEILDDQGQPVPAGQEGNVVITDLFNYGMPFIRYVNGDRAIAGFEMCPCGRGLPLLKQVVGRQLDVLETADGRKIPGEFFPHLLKEFPAIRRFQVVQRDPSLITLRLVTSEAFTDSDRAMLTAEVVQKTGTETEIVLDFVDDIPLTRAGKLKVVVRELPDDVSADVSATEAVEPGAEAGDRPEAAPSETPILPG